MACLDKEAQTDARVVELIKMIAELHNVKVEIDYNNRTVNFLCGEQKRLEISKDLATYFDKVDGEEVF